MTINETKLQEFVGKMLRDLGAAVNSPLVLIGDRLGLYQAIDLLFPGVLLTLS